MVAPAREPRSRPSRRAGRHGDPFWRRFRSGLVVAELAIALVLLAGAATIARTVEHLLRVDIGVRGERALTMEMTLPFATCRLHQSCAPDPRRLETRIATIPGVEALGFTNLMPGIPKAAWACGS